MSHRTDRLRRLNAVRNKVSKSYPLPRKLLDAVDQLESLYRYYLPVEPDASSCTDADVRDHEMAGRAALEKALDALTESDQVLLRSIAHRSVL